MHSLLDCLVMRKELADDVAMRARPDNAGRPVPSLSDPRAATREGLRRTGLMA